MTKKKRNIIIISSVLGGFVLALGIFLLVWYLGDNYDAFYSRTEVEFAQPGIEAGYTQQGLTFDEESGLFLLSGYMTDSSLASRIYVVDESAESASERYVELKLDGENFNGHLGGIAVYGDTVWLGDERTVYTVRLSDVLSAESGASVSITGSFSVINKASFLNVTDGKLWVGEFYRDGSYEVDESHRLTTPAGDTNYAFVSEYNIDESAPNGLSSLVPERILSVTAQVQGMTISAEGKFVLSTSYSLPNSKIYIHENVLAGEAGSTFEVESVDVPVYFLDSSSLIETIDAPCMAEEVVYKDGKVYVSFESACKKYRVFVREQLKDIYSFELA